MVSIDTYVWDLREKLSDCDRGERTDRRDRSRRPADGHACDVLRTPSLQAI